MFHSQDEIVGQSLTNWEKYHITLFDYHLEGDKKNVGITICVENTFKDYVLIKIRSEDSWRKIYDDNRMVMWKEK